MSKNNQAYKFYGWQNATVPAINNEYNGIHTPRDLYDALSEIWCAETCAPRMRDAWSKDNKTLGQCSITAFLAQDIFGGKVYGILRSGGNYHCYNVVGDCVFDLTSEQFARSNEPSDVLAQSFGDCRDMRNEVPNADANEPSDVLSYEDNPEQFREVHFAKEEKRLRYEYLKEKLKKFSH